MNESNIKKSNWREVLAYRIAKERLHDKELVKNGKKPLHIDRGNKPTDNFRYSTQHL